MVDKGPAPIDTMEGGTTKAPLHGQAYCQIEQRHTHQVFKRRKQFIEATMTAKDLATLMYSFKFTPWYAKASLTNTLYKLQVNNEDKNKMMGTPFPAQLKI